MTNARTESLVNSIIGEGASFVGDLETEGLIRIDGKLLGSVRTTGKVVVGESARISGTIRARSAIIGGVVRGNVFATDKIILLSGGIVVGNLFAPFFMAEDDVVIHGDCMFSGNSENVQNTLDNFIASHGGLQRGASEMISDSLDKKASSESGGAGPSSSQRTNAEG